MPVSGQKTSMWKIVCPKCHTPFRVVTESKEVIEDEEGEDIREDKKEKVEDALEQLVPTGPPMGPYGSYTPVGPVSGSLGEEVPTDTKLYEYRFKCKHCGYEWTETKEKEVVEK